MNNAIPKKMRILMQDREKLNETLAQLKGAGEGGADRVEVKVKIDGSEKVYLLRAKNGM